MKARLTTLAALALLATLSAAAKAPPDPKDTMIPNLADDANSGLRPDSMKPVYNIDTSKMGRPKSAIPDMRTDKQKELAAKTKNQPVGSVAQDAATKAYAFRMNMSGNPECQPYMQSADAAFLDGSTSEEAKVAALGQIAGQAKLMGCVNP